MMKHICPSKHAPFNRLRSFFSNASLSGVFLAIYYLGFTASMSLGAAVLTGRVVDERSQPVDGVSVFIYTGKPKEGPAVICPSCYVDCGKQVLTARDGSFEFDSVDDALTFKLLMVKDGYLSAFSESTVWIGL